VVALYTNGLESPRSETWWFTIKQVGRIEGRVYDAASGEPIAGAWLTAFLDGSSTTEDGSYWLRVQADRQVTISVEADGYEPQQTPATVSEGTTLVVDFHLSPVTTTTANSTTTTTATDSTTTGP
jgi:hypothetical protein